MKKFLTTLAVLTVIATPAFAKSAHVTRHQEGAAYNGNWGKKSPQSVPPPLRQWPPNNPTPREYEELKREGWYKEDKA